MKKVLKRLLAVVLALVMVMSMIPTTTFAAEPYVTFSEVSKVVKMEKVDTYYYGSENNYGKSNYAYVCYRVIGSEKIEAIKQYISATNEFIDFSEIYLFFKDNKLVTNKNIHNDLVKTALVNNLAKIDLHSVYVSLGDDYNKIVDSQELIKVAKDVIGTVTQTLGGIAATIVTGSPSTTTAWITTVSKNLLDAAADTVKDYITDISKAMGTIFSYVVSKGVDNINHKQSVVNSQLKISQLSKTSVGASKIYENLISYYQSIKLLDPLISPYTNMNKASFLDLVAEFSLKAIDGFAGGLIDKLKDGVNGLSSKEAKYLAATFKFAFTGLELVGKNVDIFEFCLSVESQMSQDSYLFYDALLEYEKAKTNNPTASLIIVNSQIINQVKQYFNISDAVMQSSSTNSSSNTVSTTTQSATPKTKLNVNQLKDKFPAGKYWNHTIGGKNNPDKYTSTPCKHHYNKLPCKHSECKGGGGCCYYGVCGCNSYANAVQCMGFAYKLGYDAYGVNPTANKTTGYKKITNKNDLKAYVDNKLKAGDIIRYAGNTHTVFVIGVNGDKVYVAECNRNGDCKIEWGRELTKSKIKKNITNIRSAPYELSGAVKNWAITVNSPLASKVSNTSATITCNLSGNNSTKSYGYYLSTNKKSVENKSAKSVTVSKSTTNNKLTVSVNSLTPGTTYYYRFWVKINGKSYYSAVSSFKTTVAAPAKATIKTSTSNLGINDTAAFAWSAATGADSYIVKIYKDGVIWSTSNDIKGYQYVSNKLTAAGTYQAEIISRNSAKEVVGNRVTVTVHPNVTATFKDPISGQIIKTQSNIPYGHSAIAPKAPEHEGYTFANKWDTSYTNLTSNQTITAVYTANTYTVKFVNSITNATLKTEKVKYNNAATAPSNVTNSNGYIFKGWDKSFAKIKGDTTVYTVFEWYDSAYPAFITVNSITRNSTKAGYDISAKVTVASSAKGIVSGRLVAALKSSQGALLNSTESSAFALSPGDSKTFSIFVPYDSLAYGAEIYAINSYGSNGTIAQPIKLTIDNSSAWSSWIKYTGSVPVQKGVNGVSAVETKSVAGTSTNYYRYRTKSTTTSYETSLSGWTQNGYSLVQSSTGTIDYVPTWPAGFNKSNSLYTKYNKTPKTASETATNKTTVTTSTLGYIYWHWCRNYTEGPINRWVEWSKTGKYTTFHAFYNTSAKTYDKSADAYNYKNSSVCKDSYWWNGLKSGASGLVTVKRCAYTIYNKLYNYYKISDWSAWKVYTGSVPVTKGAGTGTSGQTYYDVATKTETTPTTYYYRYKSTQKVTDPTLSSAQIVNISGNVSSKYAGKKAVVWVYKFDSTSDYTTEYISDEITIGSNGEVSISNARLFEAPTIESGDYTIVVSVKGMTESIYLGKIAAPKPKYTVTFYDYDGVTKISEQTIEQGGSAVIPSEDKLTKVEGYRFTNWSQSTVNVQDNLSIYPEREKETYVVAFVDWGSHTVELKEFEYGAELITPLLEETEEGIVAHWDMSDVPTDEKGAYVVKSNMAVTTEYETATENVVFYGTDYDDSDEEAVENSSVVSEQVVDYGDRLEVPELGEKVIVTGWVNVEDGTELGDTTVVNSTAYYPEYIFAETVVEPYASVITGTYSQAQTVELLCEDKDAVIYYTTDGSDPLENGTEYTAPIVVDENTHLSFVACAFEKNDSIVVDEYYAINDGDMTSYLVTIYGDDERYSVLFVEASKTIDFDTSVYSSEHHTFNGFLTEADGETYWDLENDVVTQNITLYPSITPHEYEVTFKTVDGTVIDTQTVSYGTSADEPGVVVPQGMAFNGWDNDDYLFVEGDTVVTAVFVPEEQFVKVTLSKTKAATMVGSLIQMNVTITPDDAVNKEVEWYSSDESVATVDCEGLVTAISAGTTEISVVSLSNGAIAKCIVTVTKNPQEEICLIPSFGLNYDGLGYIRGAKNGSTVGSVLHGFTNTEMTFTNINGEALTENSLVGTGTVVSITDGTKVIDEKTFVVTGDVTGDGLVNNRDVAMVVRYLVEKQTLTQSQVVAIDVNGDGKANNRDAAMLSRYLVGKEVIE